MSPVDRTEYNSKYYQKNKKKSSDYYQKNKKKISDYYFANKEKIQKYQKKYYDNHQDILREKRKKRYEENKEQILANQKWRRTPTTCSCCGLEYLNYEIKEGVCPDCREVEEC